MIELRGLTTFFAPQLRLKPNVLAAKKAVCPLPVYSVESKRFSSPALLTPHLNIAFPRQLPDQPPQFQLEQRSNNIRRPQPLQRVDQCIQPHRSIMPKRLQNRPGVAVYL